MGLKLFFVVIALNRKRKKRKENVIESAAASPTQDSDYAEVESQYHFPAPISESTPPVPPRPDLDYTEAYSHRLVLPASLLQLKISTVPDASYGDDYERGPQGHSYVELDKVSLDLRRKSDTQLEVQTMDIPTAGGSKDIDARTEAGIYDWKPIPSKNYSESAPQGDIDENSKVEVYEWQPVPSKDYTNPESEFDSVGKEIDDEGIDSCKWQKIAFKEYWE